jgi:superfamily II DNA or RNA helicase
MELYSHQQELIAKNPERHLLAHGTGTGKTITTIQLALKNCKSVLVVVPKSIEEKWKRDIQQFDSSNKIEWRVITKEYFNKLPPNWTSLPPYDGLIVDEAHYFSGMKSQMHKNLVTYIKRNKIQYIWLATATPYMSTPFNIFALATILGHHWSYIQFKNRFFGEKWVYGRVVPEIKKGIEGDIAKLVNTIGSTVRLDECIDMPPQIFETEYFKMNAGQEKLKEEVRSTETNPVVKFTKFHQIESGTLKGNEFEPGKAVDCDKNDRIHELCLENEKVIIVCRYLVQIDKLSEILADTGRPIFIIRGDVKDRDSVVQEAEKSGSGIVLIQSACAEGYELPSYPLMVFASLDWSYAKYAQMIGRINRINKIKKNVYIHLLTSGGVDEAVWKALKRKESFDIEIYSRDHEETRSQIPDAL